MMFPLLCGNNIPYLILFVSSDDNYYMDSVNTLRVGLRAKDISTNCTQVTIEENDFHQFDALNGSYNDNINYDNHDENYNLSLGEIDIKVF